MNFGYFISPAFGGILILSFLFPATNGFLPVFGPGSAGQLRQQARVGNLPGPSLFAIPPFSPEAVEDGLSIVQRSADVQTADYAALPRFNYFQIEHNPDGTSRTWERVMLFGSQYARLVAENGRPLPPDRDAAEKLKLHQTEEARRRESPEQRARRIGAYERERERDNLLLSEMPRAFDFTLTGVEQMAGREVYILKAAPRRTYRPLNEQTKILTAMEGTLYIDKSTFQWVKVEARVIHPIFVEGFLARISAGTRFELEQMPVGPDVWAPRRFSMKARARILFLFSRRSDTDETYYGYYAAPR